MMEKKYFSAVKQEIENICTFASAEEREKLNHHLISAISPTQCIYGQMTGNCYSDRATELIRQCSVGLGFKATLKGTKVVTNLEFNRNPLYAGVTHTPLELFIMYHQECIKDIVKYLREETDNLPALLNG